MFKHIVSLPWLWGHWTFSISTDVHGGDSWSFPLGVSYRIGEFAFMELRLDDPVPGSGVVGFIWYMTTSSEAADSGQRRVALMLTCPTGFCRSWVSSRCERSPLSVSGVFPPSSNSDNCLLYSHPFLSPPCAYQVFSILFLRIACL